MNVSPVLQGEPELMQHLFGVPRMLDALRAHYGAAASPDAVLPAAGADICMQSVHHACVALQSFVLACRSCWMRCARAVAQLARLMLYLQWWTLFRLGRYYFALPSVLFT